MGDDNSRSGRLEDERQIHDTFRRYARALDDGLDDEWVDCFIPDGVWDVRVAPGGVADVPTRTVRGHDALRAAVAAHTRARRLAQTPRRAATRPVR